MAGKNGKSRLGLFIGSGMALLLLLILGGLLYFGGYLTGGTQSSHMEGIDYSNYAWYLMIPTIIVLLLVGVSIYMLTKVSFKGKKGKTRKLVAGTITVLTLTGAIVVGIFAGFYVRAYHDSAEVSDIELQDNTGAGVASIDLGNYTILSASVEEYHAKDESHYDKYRILTFDDNWRIVVRVNNTAYWNATNQNLTGVTTTLRGYALPKAGQTDYRAVTGLYAPSTQIGAANHGDVDVLVFEGILRDPRIVHFELVILDSDGEELGKAYIHPKVELSENAWFMNTAI